MSTAKFKYHVFKDGILVYQTNTLKDAWSYIVDARIIFTSYLHKYHVEENYP